MTTTGKTVSNDTKPNGNTVFKALDGWIIIRSIGEIKESKILVGGDINPGGYKNRKSWIDQENYVYAVNENSKGLKLGDRVILVPHCPLKRIEEISALVVEKTGVQITKPKVIDGKEIKGMEVELEKYFAVSEDNIMLVVK